MEKTCERTKCQSPRAPILANPALGKATQTVYNQEHGHAVSQMLYYLRPILLPLSSVHVYRITSKDLLKPHGPTRRLLISVSIALSWTPAEAARPLIGLMHRMVCAFTPQLSLVLINPPRRDGMLSWHWCTVAAGEIRTHDLTIARPALPQGHCFSHHSSLGLPQKNLWRVLV